MAAAGVDASGQTNQARDRLAPGQIAGLRQQLYYLARRYFRQVKSVE